MTLVRKDKTGGFLEVRHYKDLLIQLVTRDLKLKYRRSVLGYVWSVLNPLLIMIVMYVVFSKLFDRNIPNFPVYLLVGRTLYDFVVSSTNKAMDGITSNAALLKKTYVSKYMFPLAKVTSCMVDYVLSLGALLIVLIFTGSPFYWTMLLFQLVTLASGNIYLETYVFFSSAAFDVIPSIALLVELTTMWMYASAIFYPVDILPRWMQLLVENFNPLYIYIKQFRDIAYSGHISDMNTIILGVGYAALFFVLGTVIFRDKQDKFILYV